MKSIITLIFTTFIYIGCATYASHEDDPEMDHSPLHDLHVTSRGPIPKGLVNAGPSALKVVFRAFDNEFELDMKLNEHLFHNDAPLKIQRHWTYYGDVTMNTWLHGHATFTFERDDYHSNFHGTMILDNTMYQIQHADKYDQFSDTEHRMAISKHGEGKDYDKTPPADLIENPHRHAERRRLNLEYFENCWPGQDKYVKKLSVGYTIDNSLKTKVLEYMSNESGSDDQKMERFVIQINADSNMIYHNQLDVILSIDEILDVGQAGSWQVNCPGDIGYYLDSLTDFRRQARPNKGGMWKALTNCFPPPESGRENSTVGYAYVGTLCRSAATGVSNYMDIRSGGTWGVNAHEAGHIFGARHSFENGQGQTGGIMDYGDGLYNDVFQFNPLRFNEVCGVLSQTIPANNQAADCWATIGKDGDNTQFNWRKTTQFSACSPEYGEYRYQTIIYECEVYVNGEKRKGSMAECDVAEYPFGETKKCAAQGMNASCGNGFIEDGEECEAAYDGTCCNSECKWSSEGECNGVDPHIDAAFMTDTNILYAVSRGRVYRYTGGQEEGLDNGYPKTIQEEWPGVTDEFAASGYIGGIIRKPAGTVIWIFEGRPEGQTNARDIKYLEINYETGQLIAEKTLDQDTLTDRNYGGVEWEDDVRRDDPLSLSEDIFRQCGGVDAGLSAPNFFYLFCGGIFVQFDWGMDIKTLRPVKDMQLVFQWEVSGEMRLLRSFVSAAFYNWHTIAGQQKARIFNAGYYIDWWGFRPIGLQASAYPLTFQPVVIPPSNPVTTTTTPGGGGDDGGNTGGGDDGTTATPGTGTDDGSDDTFTAGSGTSTNCEAETTNCEICRTGMPTTCYRCLEGYILTGTYCIEQTNDIIINFGLELHNGDVHLLAGGVTQFLTLLDNNNIVADEGIDGTAAAHLKLNADGSTDRIDFLAIGKPFIKFELEAYFKPHQDSPHGENARFFTFTDGTRERITVTLKKPNNGEDGIMEIGFGEGSLPLSCVTESKIVAGEWTDFILRVAGGAVECCVSGSCIEAAFEGPSEEALSFTIQDWHLGEYKDGIIGHVDSIKLKIVEDLLPGVAKKTLVYVVVCILLFSIVGVLGFKYRSDFLNPCGADSHSRTKTQRSDGEASFGSYNSPQKNKSIQSGPGASWWNKSQEGSPGTGGSRMPPPQPTAPPAFSGSRAPPPQPKLATSTSFNNAPPAAPTAPKRPAARRQGTGLPSVKRQNTAPKRIPARPPPRATPPPRPKPPAKKRSNRDGAPPMIDLFS